MNGGDSNAPTIADRLRLRDERPAGEPLMHQTWDRLLFLHWRVPVASVRPLIPERLSIDEFDGSAWVTISPFTIYDVRPAVLPRLPIDLGFHELNVRTYVHLNGVPGVWFFSLDANSFLAVHGARLFYYLPYYSARIDFDAKQGAPTFISRRCDGKARFSARWRIGDPLQQAEPDSIDFFLVERYLLYTEREGELYRCRIQHEPWPLRAAELLMPVDSNMAEACGLPPLTTRPRYRCAGPVSVEIWPLERVS